MQAAEDAVSGAAGGDYTAVTGKYMTNVVDAAGTSSSPGYYSTFLDQVQWLACDIAHTAGTVR